MADSKADISIMTMGSLEEDEIGLETEEYVIDDYKPTKGLGNVKPKVEDLEQAEPEKKKLTL